MPFIAKSAAPLPQSPAVPHPLSKRSVAPGIAVWTTRSGSFDSAVLSALLQAQDRPTFWLRLGHEDQDPATLLLSLIDAARRVIPQPGCHTLERLRRRPGWLYGWSEYFASLAHELGAELPPMSAVVIEQCDTIDGNQTTLELLGTHFIALLPASFVVLVFGERDIPRGILPPQALFHEADALRVDVNCLHQALIEACPDISAGLAQRVITLTQGRPVILSGLIRAFDLLDITIVQRAIERARSATDLLVRLARAWLADSAPEGRRTLALALHLGYSHPDLNRAVLGYDEMICGPWLQPLADGWHYVQPIWREPLRTVLRQHAVLSREMLARTANKMFDYGAYEQALTLWFEADDYASVSAALEQLTPTFMDRGQWDLLEYHLNRLPLAALRPRPWLLYVHGEIAAARQDTAHARRMFAAAAEQFVATNDSGSACLSWLAESTILTWTASYSLARERALTALTLAENAGLLWHQGWIAWHLGYLAALDDHLDEALNYFGRATAAAFALGDAHLTDILRQTEALALRQRELRRQREYYRQAYFATEQLEHEVAEELRQLLASPTPNLEALLQARGWLHTPLLVKQPAPAALFVADVTARQGIASRWGRLLSFFRMNREPETQIVARRPPDAPLDVEAAAPPGEMSELLIRDTGPPLLPATYSLNASTATSLHANGLERVDQPTLPSAGNGHRYQLAVSAHLLGPFRVTVNDQPVRQWPSGRGRLLFKYLLTHRDRPVARDVLMDTFWPDAEPEAARNSLNVAIYGLRRAFRAITDTPLVIYEEGSYRLSPDLSLWIDVEEFERHVEAGRDLEAAGQLAAATVEYEVATGLYQGDFLAEDLYEDWPALTRERLRMSYLDTLDRLSRIYFGHSQYATSARLCQLMLGHDNCREDAHRRLMRCYSRQGQTPLALRQYQSCADTLQRELGVEPAASTSELYERIRRHEYV